MTRQNYRVDPLDRIDAMFLVGDDCWEWVGSKNPQTGYGTFALPGGKTVSAHRYIYELLVGSIPAGMHIDHLCRNRGCVRPSHLEPVPQYVNTQRGESPIAKNVLKTHCPAGHPYDEKNTYRAPNVPDHLSYRKCKRCGADRNRRRYHERKKGV